MRAETTIILTGLTYFICQNRTVVKMYLALDQTAPIDSLSMPDLFHQIIKKIPGLEPNFNEFFPGSLPTRPQCVSKSVQEF